MGVFYSLLRLQKPDLPFSRDDANRFLPWIIGFMVFLTTLMVAGGITLNDTIIKGRQTYEDSISVQVPFQPEGMEQKTYAVADALRKTDGVRDVKLVETAKIKEWLSPWLGSGDVIDLLPLPSMIEARLAPLGDGNRPTLNAIQTKLSTIVSGTEIDDNKEWIARFSEFTRTIQMIAFTLASLMIVTTGAMIVLSCRTTMKLHLRTVELLHSMGAQDDYIARQFQANAMLLTLRGTLPAIFLATLLFLFLSIIGHRLNAPLIPEVVFGPSHLMMILIMPLVTSLVALVSARGAVMAFLKTMP